MKFKIVVIVLSISILMLNISESIPNKNINNPNFDERLSVKSAKNYLKEKYSSENIKILNEFVYKEVETGKNYTLFKIDADGEKLKLSINQETGNIEIGNEQIKRDYQSYLNSLPKEYKKFSQSLRLKLKGEKQPLNKTIPIMFIANSSRSLKKIADEINKTHLKHKVSDLETIKFVASELPLDLIKKISELDEVVEIWYDAPMFISLYDSVRAVNGDDLYNLGLRGCRASVGIVDTGVDSSHPNLHAVISDRRDFSCIIFCNPDDKDGHGTHVAGIVASTDSYYRGMAPCANITSAKVLEGGFAYFFTNPIINGIDWLVTTKNVNIIQMSINSYITSTNGLSDFTKYLDYIVYSKNKTFVVSVGNYDTDRNPSTEVLVPADAYNSISVGATNEFYDGVASYSGTGKTDNERTKVDVIAPGTNIRSTNSLWEGSPSGNSDPNCWIDSSRTGDDFMRCSGTSMAAPHVSGLAALLVDYGKSNSKPYSPLYIKAAILASATKLQGWSHSNDAPLDTSQGAGRIDALQAYNIFKDPDKIKGDRVNNHGKRYYVFNVNNAPTYIDAALVWNRHVTSSSGIPPDLNDLDLTLYNEDGQILSISNSNRDNVEYIHQYITSNGLYWFEVYGYPVLDSYEFYVIASNYDMAYCNDNDGDGYPSSSCGGNDCNDNNANVRYDNINPPTPSPTGPSGCTADTTPTITGYAVTDSQSGIKKYQYRVGSSGSWQDVGVSGLETSFNPTMTSSNYVYVKAIDYCGNEAIGSVYVCIDTNIAGASVSVSDATPEVGETITLNVDVTSPYSVGAAATVVRTPSGVSVGSATKTGFFGGGRSRDFSSGNDYTYNNIFPSTSYYTLGLISIPVTINTAGTKTFSLIATKLKKNDDSNINDPNTDSILITAFNCDVDNDGYNSNSAQCGGNDCNDNNANVNPGRSEVCNNLDDNCDGTVDGITEQCGTTSVGACQYGTKTCTSGYWSSCIGNIEPGTETCNNRDDDCDGSIDESLSQQCGTSNIGACRYGAQTCSYGNWGSCTGAVYPATETCNSIDDDCDGSIDEDLTRTCGTGSGACQYGIQTCTNGNWGSCTGVEPTAEICDNIDNDCDGSIDEGLTRTCGSNVGACEYGTETCTNGNWGNCVGSVSVSAEVCDSVDNDCDGSVDEALAIACSNDNNCQADICYSGTYRNYYCTSPGTCSSYCTYSTSITDNDNDGYDTECDNDCNDNNANINPSAAEVCDNMDNNCNSVIDEICPPAVAGIECQKNSIWQNCSGIQYNNILTSVRARCTSNNAINNARFELWNNYDNYNYFANNGYSAGDYWVYDNADINIEDSGEFEIKVKCWDSNNVMSNMSFKWLVPFGTIQPYLINSSNINVRKNDSFAFSSGIRCIGGECVNIKATLDPIIGWEQEFDMLPEGKEKIDSEIYREFKKQPEVRVVVLLKEPEIEEKNLTKEEIKNLKKEKITKKQENILEKLTDEFNLKNQYKEVNALAGYITKKGIEKIKLNPNVEYVYVDKKLYAALDQSVPLINAVGAWNLGYNGKGQSVCIPDTGIDYLHANLGSPNCVLTTSINGNQEPHSLESEHPYMDFYSNTWTITKPGFTNIAVHFNRIDLEYSFDKIYIQDADGNTIQTFTGSLNDVWTKSVPGNTIKIKLFTDFSITRWGFSIDKVLDGSISSATSNCGRFIGGYDIVNGDADPIDDEGHGTFVAGIVASQNPRYKGVAPGANIAVVKVLDNEGGGFDSNIASGIEWCIENKDLYNISVISMSLGSEEGYNNPADCDSMLMGKLISKAKEKGIITFAAAGNENNINALNYPACATNATSVGATSNNAVYSFSNSASFLDLLAPGVDITSLNRGGTTITLSGTSAAVPHAAGAAAILMGFGKENNFYPTPDEIKNALKSTGINITDTRNNLVFPRINVLAALNYLNSTSKGIISTIAGAEPFYTTNLNPQTLTYLSCLGNLKAQQSCNQTWQVITTGRKDTNWRFYAIYNHNNSDYLTDSMYVNIVNSPPTISYLPLIDINIGESENATFSVSLNDNDRDILTVRWYLNNSLVKQTTNNYPYIAGSYIFVGNYTNSGVYNVTVIVDDRNLSAYKEWRLAVRDTLECGDGMIRLCQNQFGVCLNSHEICINGLWPGCNYLTLPNYEVEEETCNDNLDNDCDNLMDYSDSNCLRPPTIVSVNINKQGLGEKVGISAIINDVNGQDNIRDVLIRIIHPSGVGANYPMNRVNSNTWQYNNFYDYEKGYYNYTIYATDYDELTGTRQGYFELYSNLYFYIRTLRNNYNRGQLVTITANESPSMPPVINSISADAQGFGENVVITANIDDVNDDIEEVIVQIILPDGTAINYTMENRGNGIWQLNNFADYERGTYNYAVYVKDSDKYSAAEDETFYILSNLDLYVKTFRDTYALNEYVNLTSNATLPTAPIINSISATSLQGFGENVVITAEITDVNGLENIKEVKVEIKSPNENEKNYSMWYSDGLYVLNNFTEHKKGTYNYKIYVEDYDYLTAESIIRTFNLYSTLDFDIKTFRDIYALNEYVNLTSNATLPTAPVINSISATSLQGLGENVIIKANITDINGQGNIKEVKAGIKAPDENEVNYSMLYSDGLYVLNNYANYEKGTYIYTIYAEDNDYLSTTRAGTFNLYSSLDFYVKTYKDIYTMSEFLNLSTNGTLPTYPIIKSIYATALQGFGENIIIKADVNDSNLREVKVKIKTPSNEESIYTMQYSDGLYTLNNFTDYEKGTYTFTIYAQDYDNLISSSSGTFEMQDNLLLYIRTPKDVFAVNEIVNITSNKTPNRAPQINSIYATALQGLGENIEIKAVITDLDSQEDIDNVFVTIKPPFSEAVNYTMVYINDNTWQMNNFTDYEKGDYSYTIYAYDKSLSYGSSSGIFSMYDTLLINVQTINDTFYLNEIVNITKSE